MISNRRRAIAFESGLDLRGALGSDNDGGWRRGGEDGDAIPEERFRKCPGSP